MTQTLTNAHIIDPENDRIFTGGVVIEDGIITEVFEGVREGTDLGGAHLAPGVVDIGVKIGEPGERHKESFKSASASALAGGVTTMIIRPDTNPAIDTPETMTFVRARAAQNSSVNIHVTSAITLGREGREMSEIGFMRDAGAIAYSDGDAVIQDSKIATRAYSYIAMMGGLVIGHIQEPYLSAGAVATSGAFATKMGLSAVSPLAEKIGLQREMALVEMSGVRYHIDQITTAAALPVLERAKASGLNVTAATSVHHLCLNEFDIDNYRTFFKLKPPLRGESDRMAIINAVKSGLIDSISSMHTPQDEESKRLPFEAAAAGAVALETLLPACLRLYHSGHLTLPEIFRAISTNPARRMGLVSGRIAIGAPADLVAFNPNKPFQLDRAKLRSKSKNTPFDGARMQGRVSATWVAGQQLFNEASS